MCQYCSFLWEVPVCLPAEWPVTCCELWIWASLGILSPDIGYIRPMHTLLSKYDTRIQKILNNYVQEINYINISGEK